MIRIPGHACGADPEPFIFYLNTPLLAAGIWQAIGVRVNYELYPQQNNKASVRIMPRCLQRGAPMHFDYFF